MITGRIDNIAKELKFYPEAVQKGIQYLCDTDIMAMDPGTYPIDGDKVYVKIAEYETQPFEKRRPERHEKYADLQFIVMGAEKICCCPVALAGEVDDDKLCEKDIVYYKGAEGEQELILQAGSFAIYFPWDLHRPNCNAGAEAQKVRKAVVKIAMDQL